MILPSFLVGPPRYRPDTPWPAMLAVLATAAIIAVALLLAVQVVPRLAGTTVFRLPDLRPGHAPIAPESLTETIMTVVFTSQVAMIALTLLAAMAFGGRPRRVLALGRPEGGVAAFLLAVFLMLPVLAAINIIVWLLRPDDLLADLQHFLRTIRSEAPLMAGLAIGFGAPASEEIVFRGFLLSALARTRLGYWGAAGLTTLVWTAFHAGYSLLGLAEVFVIGLFFCWLLWRTGSLWVPMFCHALYNSGLLLLLRQLDL